MNVDPKLNDLIEAKKILKEMCEFEKNRADGSLGENLCDFSIGWLTFPIINLCTRTASFVAGTINCKESWNFYSESIIITCKSYLQNWNNFLCPPNSLNRDCCMKKATNISKVLPTCEEFTNSVNKLGQEICTLTRKDGLELAKEGCNLSINLLMSIPKKMCYTLFASSSTQKYFFVFYLKPNTIIQWKKN
ncbi:Glycogen [starch] synthase [Meloidogyne graminicola]|uniref:Glycogen [starch] synthase n=1 Tax=Meloidogyne graminicola TaxID=189291 RepID=A0A8S9ZHZ0_9BILA|nr:Glycogen [starch] synthase [Meloidogyne graminicola]